MRPDARANWMAVAPTEDEPPQIRMVLFNGFGSFAGYGRARQLFGYKAAAAVEMDNGRTAACSKEMDSGIGATTPALAIE